MLKMSWFENHSFLPPSPPVIDIFPNNYSAELSAHFQAASSCELVGHSLGRWRRSGSAGGDVTRSGERGFEEGSRAGRAGTGHSFPRIASSLDIAHNHRITSPDVAAQSRPRYGLRGSCSLSSGVIRKYTKRKNPKGR